jgi:hypothetical protein
MLRRKGKNIPKPNNCWSQMAKLVPRGIFEPISPPNLIFGLLKF